MPKQVDEVERRRTIRSAARAVFADRGVATTGLVHVAREAGLRRSTLYHYYPDKTALIRDLADELLEDEEVLFRTALQGEGSALERIVGLARSVVALLAAQPGLGRVVLELWASEPERVRPALRRVRGTLAELIERGQARGELAAGLEPGATAALIVGLLDGLLVQVFIDPEDVNPDVRLTRAVGEGVRRLLAP